MELMSVILKNSMPFTSMAGLKVKLYNGDVIDIDSVPSTIVAMQHFKSRCGQYEFNMLGESTKNIHCDIVEIIEVIDGV